MKTPIKLDIEPGVEWLLPAATRWLEQAKRAMRTPFGAKVFDLPGGEKVTVEWRRGLDYVRISGGQAAVGGFYVRDGVELPCTWSITGAPKKILLPDEMISGRVVSISDSGAVLVVAKGLNDLSRLYTTYGAGSALSAVYYSDFVGQIEIAEVSPTGRFACGSVVDGTFGSRAAWWDFESSAVAYADTSGGYITRADNRTFSTGMSSDGSIVSVNNNDVFFKSACYAWYPASNYADHLSGGERGSLASGVSSDGTVITGYNRYNFAFTTAFAFTAWRGLAQVPPPPSGEYPGVVGFAGNYPRYTSTSPSGACQALAGFDEKGPNSFFLSYKESEDTFFRFFSSEAPDVVTPTRTSAVDDAGVAWGMSTAGGQAVTYEIDIVTGTEFNYYPMGDLGVPDGGVLYATMVPGGEKREIMVGNITVDPGVSFPVIGRHGGLFSRLQLPGGGTSSAVAVCVKRSAVDKPEA